MVGLVSSGLQYQSLLFASVSRDGGWDAVFAHTRISYQYRAITGRCVKVGRTCWSREQDLGIRPLTDGPKADERSIR